MRLTLDHLAVTAGTLEEGAGYVEAALGQSPGAGGRHAAMGTHNRLLGLGDLYLEAIAIDPEAPPPGRARWFGLDAFTGAPRLAAWVLRCDDLDAALALLPEAGRPVALARGALRWRMAVPAGGALPMDGLFPALIEWQGSAHPCDSLPGTGMRLDALHLSHPEAPELAARLAPLMHEPRLHFVADPPGLGARLATSKGAREIC